MEWVFGRLGAEEARKKCVVVTGCDFEGGFGELAALALARAGLHVVAACFAEEGCKRWGEREENEFTHRVDSVQLDVTSEESCAKCVEATEEWCRRANTQIYGLVNIAGAHDGALVDWNSMQIYDKVMQVNFLGLIRCCKSFLPHIKLSRGRVVNLTSMDGLRPLPGITAYACSKAAADAFSRTLAIEMSPFGVAVITVNPGTFKTTMSQAGVRTVRRTYDNAPSDIKEQYGEQYIGRLEGYTNHFINSAAPDPQPVADAVVSAITANWPWRRYVVGNDARWIWKPLRDCVPEALFDHIVQLVLRMALPKPSLPS